MKHSSLRDLAMSCQQHHIPVSSVRRSPLLALAVVGAIASAAPAATKLAVIGPYLFYQNVGPNVYVLGAPNPGGEDILFGADNVIPNGNAATNGVGVATTGFATTTNVATGATLSSPSLGSLSSRVPSYRPIFLEGQYHYVRRMR